VAGAWPVRILLEDAMLLIIVGLLAIAGLCYFLVRSRKQSAKSAR
jgi:LPXTG-motif cell wall-anchored protein